MLIRLSPLPSSLVDELFIDKRDSERFISRRLSIVRFKSSDTYNSNDSSLITVGYQQDRPHHQMRNRDW